MGGEPPDSLVGTREFVADRFGVVVATLLVLAVVGAGLTYAIHVSPGTQETTEVTDTWYDTGEFGHSAVVEEETDAFEEGTELVGRSTYFTSVAPELAVEYEYQYAGHGELAVESELLVVIRSTGEDGTYWEFTEELDQASTESLSQGEPHTLDGSVDVSELEARIEETEADLGGSPGEIEIRVLARTDVEGTVRGQPVDQHREDSLALTPGAGTYEVEPVESGTELHERTETTTEPVEYGPLRSVGGPVLLIGSVAGLGLLAWARRAGALRPSADQRARRHYRQARREFDDWITRGRLPPEIDDRPAVRVESLAGLVDLAIDAGSRVIEDRTSGTYCVLDDGVRFEYAPPGTVRDGWTGPEDSSTRSSSRRRVENGRSETPETQEAETDGQGMDGQEAKPTEGAE